MLETKTDSITSNAFTTSFTDAESAAPFIAISNFVVASPFERICR